jgi:hypothetical protein
MDALERRYPLGVAFQPVERHTEAHLGPAVPRVKSQRFPGGGFRLLVPLQPVKRPRQRRMRRGAGGGEADRLARGRLGSGEAGLPQRRGAQPDERLDRSRVVPEHRLVDGRRVRVAGRVQQRISPRQQ